MEPVNQIRIQYDDDQIEVMDKVNAALRRHGLTFVDDGAVHEGYCIFVLQAAPSGQRDR